MITIGRVNLTDSNITWSENGNRLDIEGMIPGGRLEAEVIRQQLLGYVDSADEPFVPVLWPDEPNLAGFYRVLDAGTDGEGFAAFRGIIRWSVQLQRVSGFAAPLIELQSTGATRASAPATAYPLVVVPDAARSVGFWDESLETWIPFNPDSIRSGAFGDVKVFNLSGYLTQFYVAPESFYDAAATVMMGEDLSVVVGRQVPNTPGAWRLSNGLYEIESTGSDLFEVRHRMWLGGDWTEWMPFLFYSSEGLSGRAPMPAPHTVTVLRNSPTEVGVRLEVTANGEYAPTKVDLSLKRGAYSVGVELRSVHGSRFAVQAAALTWSAASGYRVTADSAGVRHFVGALYEIGILSGGGVIPYQDAVSTVSAWSFTIGATDAAASGTGPDANAQAFRTWLWAGTEKQAVVMQ